MIKHKRGKTYSVPINTFNKDNLFVSFARIGSIVKDGSVNPDTANALGENKIITLKKAYSEVIERRALMNGGKASSLGRVETFNLIKDQVSSVPYEFTTYSTNMDCPIDTTGTAAHYFPKEALKRAVAELIEKNALYLFWYGKLGYRIKDNLLKTSKYWSLIEQDGSKVIQFYNLSFSPLYLVITLVINNKEIIAAGAGTHTHLSKAQVKSLEEAFFT
ncbi:YcaO-like family protein [Rossellomorea sp. AcN35-11]|nr:YcaO-like family protein [Rossellomorea sp. AcN35-11]